MHKMAKNLVNLNEKEDEITELLPRSFLRRINKDIKTLLLGFDL